MAAFPVAAGLVLRGDADGVTVAVLVLAAAVPRQLPTSTGEAFGRLSRSVNGWHWEPDPRPTRIGFGPVELPASWRVVDQERVRSGVFTSHVTVGSADDPRTVTFWCSATTMAEVVAAC